MFRDSDLFSAIADGDVTEVSRLFEEINDPDIRDKNNRTPLDVVVIHSWQGDEWRQIIDYFFARSDLSREDINIALVYYSKIGDLAKVKECLDRGADVNFIYDDGYTALHRAVEGKHVSVIEYLLTIDGIDLDAVDPLHETALIKAVFHRLPEVVNLLLEKGAPNLYIQGYLTGTALTYAVFSGQNEVAKQLLTKETRFYNQNHPGALNCAIMRESKEMIGLLVAKGADINIPGCEGAQDIPDNVWQMNPDEYTYPAASRQVFTTPLCCAIQQENEDVSKMVKLLLETYNADSNKETPDGDLPLIIAARRNEQDVFQLLLNNRADLQKELSNGKRVQNEIETSYLIPDEIRMLLQSRLLASQQEQSVPQTTSQTTSYIAGFFLSSSKGDISFEELESKLESKLEQVHKILNKINETPQVSFNNKVEGMVINIFHLLSPRISEQAKAAIAQTSPESNTDSAQIV